MNEGITWNKKVCAGIYGVAPLPGHMVEAEIKLVEGEHLLCCLQGLSCGILVNLTVINLQRSKNGVLKGNIQSAEI